MDELINVVGKLHEVFSIVGSPDGLDLPEIVVVGSQSSGKTSVLESIVGRDFLPRGTGIVTRRPLLLQLVQVPKTEQESAVFLHKPDKRFDNFDEVRTEIEIETQRVASQKGKCISSSPINLKIFSPFVPTLSLVDLPGMTKVPVGDQPDNIELVIRDMILTQVSNPNAIILAITAANVDFATSDAIKLAREVDPDGTRTLAVLTKLDLMDKGTNATETLTGKVVSVKLGIIGVVNRSQADINNAKVGALWPLQPLSFGFIRYSPFPNTALHDDSFAWGERPPWIHSGNPQLKSRHLLAAIFEIKILSIGQNHNLPNELDPSEDQLSCDSHVNGTAYLAQTLSCLLASHVQEALPSLRTRINEQRAKYQAMLDYCGSPVCDDIKELANALLTRIGSFVKVYSTAISGSNAHVEIGEICAGAKICDVFHETYAQELQQIEPLGGLDIFNILAAIRNATGPMPALGAPQMSFVALARYQIKRFEEPSARCVDLVYGAMQGISLYCGIQLQEDSRRFPQLYTRITEIMSSLLDKQLPVTKHEVAKLVAMETAYINVKHPDFKEAAEAYLSTQGASPTKLTGAGKHAANALVSWGGIGSAPAAAVFELLENAIAGEFNQTSEEMGSCSRIEKLLNAYVMIVRKIIQDAVPKVIMRDFVEHILMNMDRELTLQLHNPELLETLMKEAEPIERSRQDSAMMLEALQKASQIIADVQFSCMTFNSAEQQQQRKLQQQLQQQQQRQQLMLLQEQQAKRNQQQQQQQEDEAKAMLQQQPHVQQPQQNQPQLQSPQGSDVDFPST